MHQKLMEVPPWNSLETNHRAKAEAVGNQYKLSFTGRDACRFGSMLRRIGSCISQICVHMSGLTSKHETDDPSFHNSKDKVYQQLQPLSLCLTHKLSKLLHFALMLSQQVTSQHLLSSQAAHTGMM